MPKSTKQRKQKAADFAKAKLKLGKKKQLANNVVDTSFKARSIALPNQSIAVEKDDAAPTTKRRLTLEDLLGNVKHHNAGARRDALLGLRELIQANPQIIDSSLTSLVTACVRIIADEDSSVRKSLLSFLTWLLPRVSQENILPHASRLLLFTTSAQTHIFPEIRIDAIKFLDLLMEIIPQAVVADWTRIGSHGNRVLEGYLGILNAGTKFGETEGDSMKATSTASVVLSKMSKCIVLTSLSRYLRAALSADIIQANSTLSLSTVDESLPTWYLQTSFTSPEAFRRFDRLLQPAPSMDSISSRTWHQEENENFLPVPSSTREMTWSVDQILDVSPSDISKTDMSESSLASFAAHLASTLHSTLVAAFLDAAPCVFSPNRASSTEDLQMIVAVADISKSLYGAVFRSSWSSSSNSAHDLALLLGYMSPYFPFQSHERDIKAEQYFQDLNLFYCELTSSLALATKINSKSGSKSSHGRGKGKEQDHSAAFHIQTGRVSEYIIKLLTHGLSGPTQLARPLSCMSYAALVPTLWSLLNRPFTDGQFEALSATVDHAIETPAKSAIKRLTIAFLSRVVLLETDCHYVGSFSVAPSINSRAKLEQWIETLPQTLWELGANSVTTTEMIIRLLLRFLQRKSSIGGPQTTSTIYKRLMPYFVMKHPSRGEMPGPYTKLPLESALRYLTLDLAIVLEKSIGSQSDEQGALIKVVDQAVRNTPQADYWAALQNALISTSKSD